MGQFEETLKKGAWTAAEVLTVTGGAVIATQFLPARKIFEKQVTADPTYVTKPMYKYFGGLKAAGACAAASFVSNPWIKLALIGVAVQGTIEQAMVLTADGAHPLMPIGDSGAGVGDMSSINEKLKALAETSRNSMMGNSTQSAVAGAQESAVAGVAGWGDEASGGVAGGYDW